MHYQSGKTVLASFLADPMFDAPRGEYRQTRGVRYAYYGIRLCSFLCTRSLYIFFLSVNYYFVFRIVELELPGLGKGKSMTQIELWDCSGDTK